MTSEDKAFVFLISLAIAAFVACMGFAAYVETHKQQCPKCEECKK